MAPGLYKFPRTPHLHNLGAATRDDLVMDPRDALTFVKSTTLVIEEKIDGGNLGISFDPDSQKIRFQKRGHYIAPASEAQFAKLAAWADSHRDTLWRILGTDRILYGEWLCARHTVAYDKLPDWFLVFDILDLKTNQFYTRAERLRLLAGTGLHSIRLVHQGPLDSVDKVVQLLLATRSSYTTSEVQAEGLYLRVEDGQQLQQRAKLVHPDFIQAIEESSGHWSKRSIQYNCVRPDLWEAEQVEAGQEDAVQEAEQPHPQASAVDKKASAVKAVPMLAKPPSNVLPPGSSGDRLRSKHGVICLAGPGVDAVAQQLSDLVPAYERQQRASQCGPGHHMTIITPAEVKQLLQAGASGATWSSAEELAATCHYELCASIKAWLPISLGSCTQNSKASPAPSSSSSGASAGGRAYFCVVLWPAAQRLRAMLGLSPHQLHITLGFNPSDVHGPGVDKGINSLSTPGSWWAEAGRRQIVPVLRQLGTAAAQATDGLMGLASCQAGILVMEALDQLEHKAPGSTAASPQTCLAALGLARLGLEVLHGAQDGGQAGPAGATTADKAAGVWVATVCAHAVQARALGLMGQLDEALQQTTAAIQMYSRAGRLAAEGTKLGKQLSAAGAYAGLLQGRALFGLGRTAEAREAFETAQKWAGLAQQGGACAALGSEGVEQALLARVWDLYDDAAARQGSDACNKRLARDRQVSARAASSGSGDGSAAVADLAEVGLPSGCSGPLNPRERCVVPGVGVDGATQDVTLPRNTSWLVVGELMGSSTPKNREQIFALHTLGVRLVLTLTEETPLPAEWFRGSGVRNLFVPVPNYEPPSIEQMDQCMEALEQCMEQGAAALVHCGGGKGRAGTVLACYMCKHGLEEGKGAQRLGSEPCMASELAVKVLRGVRPGSIETQQQQRFVGTYCKHLWKQYAQQGKAVHAQAAAGNDTRLQQQQQHKAQGGGKEDAAPKASRSGASSSTSLVPSVPSTPAVGGSSSDEGPALQVQVAGSCPAGAGGWQLPGSYPRTPHLPFSPQVASDDLQQDESSCGTLLDQEVVVTEKLDGGNLFLFQGRVYARSQRQEASHAWFSMAKGLAAGWRHLIPDHLAIVAENMQAVHSIEYGSLTSPLYLLAVWDCARQVWGSWDEVLAIAELLNVPTAPMLYRGTFSSLSSLRSFMEDRVRRCLPSIVSGPQVEGFVVRQAAAIPAERFGLSVAKYVRQGHVQTAADWTRTWRQAVIHSHLPMPPACCGMVEGVTPGVEGDLNRQDAGSGQPKQQETTLDVSEDEHKQNSAGDGSSSAMASVAGPGATGASKTSEAGGGRGGRHGGRHTGGRTGKEAVKKTAVKLPKLLMLVGLPGSGKSTFADALVASNRGWVRICQDECGGSRRTCESAFSHAALRGSDHGRHVILDRCNATADDRRVWLDLALIGKRDKGVQAVWFDVHPEECIRRVGARSGHPTLPASRGFKAVTSFAKVLQPPTVAEGFERVHVVRTFEEANVLLASLGAADPVLAAAALPDEQALPPSQEGEWQDEA